MYRAHYFIYNFYITDPWKQYLPISIRTAEKTYSPMHRWKRDVKFIHGRGASTVCHHKIAFYSVAYLPVKNKIWLYKSQRCFLRHRPVRLSDSVWKTKGWHHKDPLCQGTRVTTPWCLLFISSLFYARHTLPHLPYIFFSHRHSWIRLIRRTLYHANAWYKFCNFFLCIVCFANSLRMI